MNRSYKKIAEDPVRTIVVGDVHGCYDELMRLLEDLAFSDKDLLVAVGDIVDRGPETWAVASFFRDTPNAFSVMGNHERKLAGAIRGTIQPAWTQLHSLSKLPQKDHPVWADYFESLPTVIETTHAVITHARLDPDLPIDRQNTKHACAVGGQGVTIEMDASGIPKWYHRWACSIGNSKPVCIGHIGYRRVELVPKLLYALDTEVAKGGSLSAVILPEGRVVHFSSGRNHYNESYKEWSLIRIKEFDPVKMPIHKYISIRKKDQRDSVEEFMIQRFETCLSETYLDERLNRLKEAIRKKEGDVPDTGPARGEYYIALKSKYPGSYHRFISLSLSEKPFFIDQFLASFQKYNLLEVLDMLAAIEKNLVDSEA